MKPLEILHKFNLRQTGCREGILSLIIDAGQALSENEIRDKIENKYDRTTFYRSFKTLLQHKIIHKIVVDKQLVKYALNVSVTGEKKHAHFYCKSCNKVICTDSISLEQPDLPEGYKVHETDIIIKGMCNNCILIDKISEK